MTSGLWAQALLWWDGETLGLYFQGLVGVLAGTTGEQSTLLHTFVQSKAACAM